MSALANGRALDCVLVDLNTQHDFCLPGGAYPVANLSEVIPALRRVMDWARKNRAPIVSSIDSHRRWELNHEGVQVHCVDGTDGQRKLPFTIMKRTMMVEGDNTLGVKLDWFDEYQQVMFRKRTQDLLGNPKADRFLTQLPCRQYVLFGNGVENSVKSLALGLLARGKPVTILEDACGFWSASDSDLAVRLITAKGARMMRVDEFTGSELPRNAQAMTRRPRADRPVVKPPAAAIIRPPATRAVPPNSTGARAGRQAG